MHDRPGNFPCNASSLRSAASARSSRARLLHQKIIRFNYNGRRNLTDLAAFLPKPVPFPSSASAVPSPANAYLDVTRAPALRFFAVCAPVCRDGTTSHRFPAAPRRRRRAVGRARDCAPPHCKGKGKEDSAQVYMISDEEDASANMDVDFDNPFTSIRMDFPEYHASTKESVSRQSDPPPEV